MGLTHSFCPKKNITESLLCVCINVNNVEFLKVSVINFFFPFVDTIMAETAQVKVNYL